MPQCGKALNSGLQFSPRDALLWGQSRPVGACAAEFRHQDGHIGELFADANVFVMPPFQRPYCWGEEASQLYDDISSAMMRGEAVRTGRKNRQEYFLGPIIVTRGQAPGVLEVIDGQQRLATLAILLAILRDAPWRQGVRRGTPAIHRAAGSSTAPISRIATRQVERQRSRAILRLGTDRRRHQSFAG